MALQHLLLLNKDELNEFFASFDTILTDCDGVLWLENNVIAGASDVINKFRDMGKKIFFVTNNSTRLVEDFIRKANDMGFLCKDNEMISAAYLAAHYLKTHDIKKAYVFGTTGITRELELIGIQSFGPGPDVMPDANIGDYINNRMILEKDVGAVVVGFDPYISYAKIMKAASYLSDPDCLYVATNTDENFPVGGTNIVVPGTGTIVSAVSTCSGREPTVVGKPNPYIVEAIMKEYNIDPARTLMIGDRCNTDILLGTRCGFKTLLVLSGVTSLDVAAKYKMSENEEDQKLVPDMYLDKLGDILPLLQSLL